MKMKTHLLEFRAAIESGDLDGAAILLHKIPDPVKPAGRAELARLRGEAERLARFAPSRDAGGRSAPQGVALRSRTG